MLCTTASYEELKEATCFRERWRFRAREISHTLPVRHADEVARLGAWSPLGGHFRDDPRGTRWFLPCRELRPGCGNRRGLDSVGTVLGSTAEAGAPAGFLCKLPTLKQRRLKSVWEPLPSHHSMGRLFSLAHRRREGRATLMGLRRAVAGTAARGHSFLSLTDNMSSLLVCDRGR